MRIVLDTNVLIAGLVARGTCAQLLEHCLLRHTVVTSDFILDELREKLSRKFLYSDEEVAEAVDLLKSRMEFITATALSGPVCRDPDDDAILAAAVSGNAVCIVTGDKDLLMLNQYQGIAVLDPKGFADFEAQRSP